MSMFEPLVRKSEGSLKIIVIEYV